MASDLAREMAVQSVLDWTPPRVRAALYGADAGVMADAADLCEAIMTDDRVAGVLSSRTLSLLGMPLVWEGAPQVLEALKGDGTAHGDWWDLVPEEELAKLLNWGIVFGVGLGELVPTKREDGRIVPRLKVWHPRWLNYRTSTDEWRLSTSEGQVDIRPGDGKWLLFTPYGRSRPWALGAWRVLQWPWIVKRYATLDWQRQNETTGSPIRVGKAPEGSSRAAREGFRNDLKALGRDAAMVLPAGYDLELVESSSKNWDTFQATIQWADAAFEVTLVGQVVTTEGSAGFSDGGIHQRTRIELLTFSGQTLSTAIRDQVLANWVRWNYPGAPVPWVSWDTTLPEDKSDKAETLLKLGDAITRLDAALSASGQRTNAVELAQAFGIPMVELPPTKDKAPTVTLAPTDVAKVIKVNEARASAGLGPLRLPSGEIDPDGDLTVDEFSQKKAADNAAPQNAPIAPLQPLLHGIG